MAVIQRLIDLKQQLHAASADPREKEKAHTAQLGPGKGRLAEVRRELALQLRRLEEQLRIGTRPGAGYQEVQRVQWSLDRSLLPREDPLAVRALQRIGEWETSNAVLRDKAKLSSAVARTSAGFSKSESFAGQRLGTAILEVRTEGGLGSSDFVDAKQALTKWQDLREKEAREDLRVASYYGDELALKDALALCRESGVPEETLAAPTAQYQKLCWTQDVNKKLQEAIENGDTDALEQVIAFAHTLNFVEGEFMMLQAATLQVQLHFWAEELTIALQLRNAEGLTGDVKTARKILDHTQRFLKIDPKTEGRPPDVVFTELGHAHRALERVLPEIARFADMSAAEADLERVLGAVERYAAELPEVIERGREKEANGLLIHQAEEHLKAYDKTVADLRQALAEHMLEDEPSPSNAEKNVELKDMLIKARMAGAPDELVDKASARLEQSDPELFKYSQVELELRIALAEADDIKEMTVEDRFVRLQNAADAARSLQPPLDAETMAQVDEISIALAAERTLTVKMNEAENVLRGGPRPSTAASETPEGSTEGRRQKNASPTRKTLTKEISLRNVEEATQQVEEVAAGLRTALVAAEMSALEEAQKAIPAAEALAERLEEEGPLRHGVLLAVQVEAEKWRGRVSDLRDVIIAAREASVAEYLLDDAYTELNTRKVAFLLLDLQSAVSCKQRALATGLALRGRILQDFAREGEQANLIERIDTLCPSADGVLTIRGMIRGNHCGGVFGGETWRKNPLFAIRQGVRARDQKSERPNSARRYVDQGMHVSVALAEGSSKLATLAVHVVRNCAAAAACGCNEMLMPGFEVLAGSNRDDDFPHCEFDLPAASDDKRPVFIVPSAAKGEEGFFTLVIQAAGKVEVSEVTVKESKSWPHSWQTEITWSGNRPLGKQCGGGRVAESAPKLSWYRNPQFRVRIAGKKVQAKDSVEAMATSWGFAEVQSEAAEGAAVTMPAEEPAVAPTAKRTAEAIEEPHVTPLLQVLMLPKDRQQKVPVAVHTVRNLSSNDDCIQENSMLHAIVASSSTASAGYQIASEVGTVCALPPAAPDREDGQGEPLFVVPSLESKQSRATFMMHLLSTVPIDIERVN